MTVFAPVRVTAMYRAHVKLGARFTSDGDWRVPEVYDSADDEVARARTAVGISDVSACGKLGLRGESVELLLAKLVGQSAPVPARAIRARLNGTSTMMCRLASDEALLLTRVKDLAAVAELLEEAAGGVPCVHLTDLTSAFAVVDVIGPRVGALFERLVPVDLSARAVPPLAVVPVELARVRAILVRLELPELPAYRVLVPREYGQFVWDALVDAGHDLGLTPVGAAARRQLLGAENA